MSIWPFGKKQSMMQKLSTDKNSSVQDLNTMLERIDSAIKNSSPGKAKQKIDNMPESITKMRQLLANVHDTTADDFFKKYNIMMPYHPLTHDKTRWDFYKKLDFSGWSQYKKNVALYSKFHNQTLHITMQLKTGNKIMFWINEVEDGFVFNKGQYIFDVSKRYDIFDSLGYRYGAYDYYEGFPLPIKHELPIDEIRDAVEKGKIDEELAEVAYSFNPILLLKFVISDIIKKLFAKDEDKNDWIFWIVCGIAIISVIHFGIGIYTAIKTGHNAKVLDFMQTQLNALAQTIGNWVRK